MTGNSQSITLTGLDTEGFQDIIKALSNVNHLFASEVPKGSLGSIESINTEGHMSFRFSNNYLSHKFASSTEAHHPSVQDIDPYGILRKMAGNRFVHSEENVVEYYKRRRFVGEDGST